jgi:hypothetical protein
VRRWRAPRRRTGLSARHREVAIAHDRDIIAVALNERYAELGGDHPITYFDDDQPDLR